MSAAYAHPAVKDSYTGLMWCGAAKHLLDEKNRTPTGKCRPCATRAARLRRRAGGMKERTKR